MTFWATSVSSALSTFTPMALERVAHAAEVVGLGRHGEVVAVGLKFSPPASITHSSSWSSSMGPFTSMTPLRSNCHETAPGSAIVPPFFAKTCLISALVRLRLSVRVSTMTATPARP